MLPVLWVIPGKEILFWNTEFVCWHFSTHVIFAVFVGCLRGSFLFFLWWNVVFLLLYLCTFFRVLHFLLLFSYDIFLNCVFFSLSVAVLLPSVTLYLTNGSITISEYSFCFSKIEFYGWLKSDSNYLFLQNAYYTRNITLFLVGSGWLLNVNGKV